MIDLIVRWLTASWLRLVSSSLMLVFFGDLFFRRLRKVRDFRRKINKLPGPPAPNPFLGNVPYEVLALLFGGKSDAAIEGAEFYASQIQSVLGHTLIYKKEALFRLWIGQEPVVCVWRPEIIELVLGNNFLLEKSYHYDFLRPWLGNGLLTSPGRIWRPRRKLLVPSFHFQILKAFVPVFERKSKLMCRLMKQRLLAGLRGDSTIVDITPVITACTLDAICETIMGVAIDAQKNPNNDYCQSIQVVGETFLERIIQPRYWLDIIFRATELGKLYAFHLNKLHSFTRKVIAEKKLDRELPPSGTPVTNIETHVRRLEQTTVDKYRSTKKDAPELPKAFLDLLLERNQLKGEQRLTDEEIREEVDTFMFEGHDTTAMALSWTLFLLGHHQEAQDKLREEVDTFFQEQNLTNDSEDCEELDLDCLKKLKYLDCVIKEALRLCPSVPLIGRQTTSDLKLGDHVIPPGSVIFMLIYQLHRNPDIYPNPELFDPDRFLPESTLGRHPYAYVPFSAGPRNCIGQKFAMAEMKTVLIYAIRNFKFHSMTPLDKARVQMEMVLRPKSPLNMRVIDRWASHTSGVTSV